jgi:hypothetical protein
LTSKVIKSSILELEEEKKAQIGVAEKPPNCTAVLSELRELAARKDVMLGLQIMGVFTLCGVLATLGWGGGGG